MYDIHIFSRGRDASVPTAVVMTEIARALVANAGERSTRPSKDSNSGGQAVERRLFQGVE